MIFGVMAAAIARPDVAAAQAGNIRTPVTGSFTAVNTSTSFIPLEGRAFNVTLRGTFTGSIQLERSFDGGTNWHPITASGVQLYIWTAAASEIAIEPQSGVLYRLNATVLSSGTAVYRISQ